jgi:hypothetical protein
MQMGLDLGTKLLTGLPSVPIYWFVAPGHVRGQVLKYTVAFTLMRARKIVRGAKAGLTEQQRYAVVDHAVDQLMQRGDPWG